MIHSRKNMSKLQIIQQLMKQNETKQNSHILLTHDDIQ